MKLDYKDIQRIAREVEKQEIEWLELCFGMRENEYYCEHEDAGDRV